MDANQFDGLARLVGRASPRRRFVVGLALSPLVGFVAARRPDDAPARKRHKRKKRKQPKPNAFGCLDVGKACKNNQQCCSDICQGKKGRKRCKAHDTGGCPAGSLSGQCGGETLSCRTVSGVVGRCETTTGNAGYCAGGGDCFACTKDAECQAVCGPRAACAKCPGGCSIGTQCVGPDNVVCPL